MDSTMLYAMVDKAGHVCRDEDGKVVYDREDHPSLDVRRFNTNRPQSAPHVVVPFVTHAYYRALEDENRSLRASFDEAHELWVKATEELASIKARPKMDYYPEPDVRHREALAAIRAALAQPRPVGVPDGYRLVPVEPTEVMVEHGKMAHYEADEFARDSYELGTNGMSFRANRAKHVYKAMLTAAPDGEVVKVSDLRAVVTKMDNVGDMLDDMGSYSYTDVEDIVYSYQLDLTALIAKANGHE